MDVRQEIKDMCDRLAKLLIEKNRKYGNSALDPVRVFSKADLLETIRVRMDDKLCRIKNEQSDEDEDVYMDLAGYLVLYMIGLKQRKAQRVTYAQARKGLQDDTITLSVDNAKQLAENRYGGDLSTVLKAGKASSIVGLDKMSPESLDCLLCQAQESGDHNLVKQIQDEQDRRDSVDKPKNQILFKGRPISMATDKELTDTLDSLLTGENKYRPDALLQIGYLADECTRRGITLKPFARHLDDDVTPTT